VRINAQLVDATMGSPVWAERYDRELQDVFALQDEITREIVTALAVKLTQGERESVVRRHTNSLEAYDYFLRGVTYYWRFTPETNVQARQLWEKAIELDSAYADAYAGLGFTYWIETVMQWRRDPQALERALELAQKALTLDDSLASPHMLLGSVYYLRKQYERAIAEGKQAITLEPNLAMAYQVLAEILNVAGRSEEALGMVEKAMRLDPHYPPLYVYALGWTYSMLGRYEEAIPALKKAVTLHPDFWLSHLLLAVSYSELDRHAEAQAAAAEVLKANPHFSVETAFSIFKDQTLAKRWTVALREAGLK
jgi:adenylate cyclase